MRIHKPGVTTHGSGHRDWSRRLRGRHAGWRSHTFSDGVCAITLTAPLDSAAADRLRERLRELSERGCERVIVDVTAAMHAGAHAPALLAAVLQAHLRSCEVVVIVPRDSALDRLLPAHVAVAWSLTDARLLLASSPGRWRAVERPGPGEPITAGDRHALAVRQALRWASQTAGSGDYESALRGLTTIERVEGPLSEIWQQRRDNWAAASRRQVAGARPARVHR